MRRGGASGPLDDRMLAPILSDSPDGGPSIYYCIGEMESEEARFPDQRTSETTYARAHVWASFLGASLLDIILLAVELLEDFSDNLNDEGRDYIARVRSGVQRMGTLIDALLQLSRVTRTIYIVANPIVPGKTWQY